MNEAGFRARIARVLANPACADIQFKLGPISIRKFMYNYIAGAVLDSSCKLKVVPGDNPQYFNKTRTLQMNEGVNDATIVHECTHVLINETHQGKTISRLLHETAAYIAESLWAKNTHRGNSIDDTYLRLECARLAQEVKDYNKITTACYEFDLRDCANIGPLLDKLKYDHMNMTDLQIGIY
jgi:hypothetical protein